MGGAALPRARQDRKDKEKEKRGKGQSSVSHWKSEAEMVLRCVYSRPHQPPPISLCRWMSRRRVLRNVCCCRKAPLPSLQTVCDDMFIRHAGSSTIHDAGSSMTAVSIAQTKGAVQLRGGICLCLHDFAEDFCTLAHASVYRYCCKKRKICRYTGSETNAGHSCHVETPTHSV